MGLVVSAKVREKLARKTPPVSEDEILQCFANRHGQPLTDTREQHLTDPLTRWFIAETDYGRKLKVVYIPIDGDIVIKTAYDPNDVEQCIFDRFGSPGGA